MDIDRIEPGQDFVDAINKSVAEAGVLLVLIGREWMKMTDKSSVLRLNNPEDFGRLEILAGLEQKTVIIPVLLCRRRDAICAGLAGAAAAFRAQERDRDKRFEISFRRGSIDRGHRKDIQCTKGNGCTDQTRAPEPKCGIAEE